MGNARLVKKQAKKQVLETLRREQVAKVADSIKKFAQDEGLQVVDARDFFKGIEELYLKPSLTQVVEEEMPQLLKADPNFFKTYGINLPENLETYLSDLYSSRGKSYLRSVLHSAKVRFRHLHFHLAEHPDRKELYNTIREFKKILDGKYIRT